jgi:putative toxin-antitoxin system antitoxin component (TIGR02293 family)
MLASLPLKGDSAVQVIAEIETGLPFSSVDSFHNFTGLPLETIASLVRIPLRTLSRRRAAGRLKPDESERLLRISRIVDRAIALFEGDRDAAMQWLATPQPGLNAEKPLEFARSEIGAREVEDLIGRLEHGVFS